MSFETLKNILKENREQAERDYQESLDPTECPYDAWDLKVNSEGQKSCPICGRIWGVRTFNLGQNIR